MKKEMKTYTAAPLPFQGQKRRHVKEFASVIKTLRPELVIDLFGGSGLLAHTAKRAWPATRVIYNDYDNFCERLAHVDGTNKLLCCLRALLRDFPKESRITGTWREAVVHRLAVADRRGYVDWRTLSASLLFNMHYGFKYEDFENKILYNRLRISDYTADGYLDGLEVVYTDYRELCARYRDISGALFIADPPYLSTDTSTYNLNDYWHLKDYLDVLPVLDGLNFIYFTSEKSQIVELCEWLDSNGGKVRNIFKGASVTSRHTSPACNSTYTDVMLCKLNLKDG